MAVNPFMSFFDKADGESIQKGKEKWIEIQGWNWDVEADSSWTRGGHSLWHGLPVGLNYRSRHPRPHGQTHRAPGRFVGPPVVQPVRAANKYQGLQEFVSRTPRSITLFA